MMKNKHKHKLVWIGTFILVIGGLAGAANYLVDYGFGRGEPATTMAKKKARRLTADQRWLRQVHKETWHQQAVGKAVPLVATYVPAVHKTNKTVIVAHGYHENASRMASYIRMFHEAGYNVLAPDDRGSGRSGGHYVTFGWLDRLDYVKWCHRIVRHQGTKARIALFGVSMGAATVMMTSGEKLPPQVKAVVADCGYASVHDELATQLEDQFHVPQEPLLTLARGVARIKVGFDFNDASVTKQLHKNHLPIFIIHGENDHFVPTKMGYENYAAANAPKQLWIVKNAGQAMAYYEHPQEYRKRVLTFLEKWV